MIISFLLQAVFYIVGLFVAILPTGSLPSQVSSGFSSIVGYMYAVNNFFPIDTLIYLAGLALAVQAVIVIWNLGHMLIRYVRGN